MVARSATPPVDQPGRGDGIPIGRRNRAWLPPSALFGVVVAIAVVVLSAWLSYAALSSREQAVARLTSGTEIGRRLDAVMTSAIDAETGQRGYLLTGDESYLEPYRRGQVAMPLELRRLRELLNGKPDQLRNVDRMAQLLADKFDEMDQTIERRATGDLDGAIAIVRSAKGRHLMDDLRRSAATLREHAEAMRSAALGERDAAVRNSFLVTAVAAAVLIAFIVWAATTLSRGYRQRETEIWVRSGIAALTIRLRGDPRLEALGSDALAFLAGWLDAQVGAFHLVDPRSGATTLVATWAADAAVVPARSGAGLLGQAVREQRVVHLRDLPPGYLTVSSSLGQSNAREIVIVPAIFEGLTAAAFEIGFLRPVGEAELDLLERSAVPLGVTVRSAIDRTRLEELLAETQRQAEELQTQQEELRVSNEELEEQSRVQRESQGRLESSQAELEATNSQLEEQAQLLEDQRDALAITKVELTRKAVDLERSSRYKSEFLANMSHELRTPLNSTLILARLLAENRKGNLDDEQVKFAETISSAGNDLLTLINDILDLSRIEAGKVEVDVEPVVLESSLESLGHVFMPMARQKGLAFATKIDDGAPKRIETDGQRLAQILRNLVANAIKFTDAGSVTVRVGAAGPGHVAFAVEDTGIGIADDKLDLVFEAFQQASAGTARMYGGTGLGLTISRDLARLLGGAIDVRSRVGEGSVFTLTLPLRTPVTVAPPDEAPVPAPPVREVAPRPPVPAQAQPRQSRRDARPATPRPDDDRERLRTDRRLILVIEDDPAFSGILRDLAHEMDFQCVVAETADEGLEAAAEFQPSAIVLDMQLPDHSGLGVLEQLKRDPRTRHIPVHVASASDFSHEALELGAIGYAIKPVERQQLVEALRKLEARFSNRGQGRVLVVEDDPRQRDSLVELLDNDKVEIVSAANAAEALAQLRARTFDCVVMDLNLPDLSGYELLEKMAEDDAHGFPPVIVYTGRTLSRDEEQRLRRHSKSIIVKGARSPERLLDEVTLFLHQVESDLPAESQRLLRSARDREQAFEGRRILVVEDDVRNVFALTSVLEPKGAVATIARNGREGIEALERADQAGEPIELVLMDIMMPEMDGYAAMREIRKRSQWRRLPIIALTAKAMRDDQQKCIDAGASDYIAKPLDVDKLLSLARVWLAA